MMILLFGIWDLQNRWTHHANNAEMIYKFENRPLGRIRGLLNLDAATNSIRARGKMSMRSGFTYRQRPRHFSNGSPGAFCPSSSELQHRQARTNLLLGSMVGAAGPGDRGQHR